MGMSVPEQDALRIKVLKELSKAYLDSANQYIVAHSHGDEDRFGVITMAVGRALIISGGTIIGNAMLLPVEEGLKPAKDCLKAYQKIGEDRCRGKN